MAYHSDKAREQIFYRYELVAKRKQKSTRATEKFFSLAYGATARCGDSIGLPFVWLAVLVLVLASFYWVTDVGFINAGAALTVVLHDPINQEFLAALEFSFARVFPFGAFEDVSREWIDNFESGDTDTVATLALRIAASVQSALALALVFVFGLSVRRKFQIS